MIVNSLIAGMYEENCYIIMDEKSKDAAIIDPGGSFERIKNTIEKMKCNIKFILLTHGHADHVGAVEALANEYKVPFYINKKDEEAMAVENYVFGDLRKADGYVSHDDTLRLGEEIISVIETPGHTPGGVCYLVDNKCFTGDTLFQGAVGRSDFYGGNGNELIRSIKENLLVLDEDVEVYPGHGPCSTIGFEKRSNPFLG
ncbi:MAG: MBL fold metallo-hydrolase [Clostridiaceae bacterium]|nr:MBL fold metallo-hydrolase [Clostridiaceae bacterium]